MRACVFQWNSAGSLKIYLTYGISRQDFHAKSPQILPAQNFRIADNDCIKPIVENTNRAAINNFCAPEIKVTGK
jgi:hypothetical protein